MTGFLCIAMMKEPPYFMTIGITEYEPDVWAENLLLPSHLLCYEGFRDPQLAESQYLHYLLNIGIEVKSGKSFKAQPDEVIKAFIAVHDDIMQQHREEQSEVRTLTSDTDNDESYEYHSAETEKNEGQIFYELAKECAFASDKAFYLYQQAAQLDYPRAYIALAHAYFNGWGVKRNVSNASKWIHKLLDSIAQLNSNEREELGELLHSLATEYSDGSDQAIPDHKKAYQFNVQSAELGCELAYTSLACAYLTGDGVEKNLNAALEWSMREIEAGIIYGYNHATSSFVEAGMKQQAELLWKHCFKEQAMENIATSCLRVYRKQVLECGITIDSEIEALFNTIADYLTKYQEELGVSIYDEEIAWLGIRDTCLVCHIPIPPETARKTEGKCANCFIKELS
jgi:TPR repeat protein